MRCPTPTGETRHLPASSGSRNPANAGILPHVTAEPDKPPRATARLNVNESARYLDVHRDTILAWRRRGLLPERGTWSRAELDAAHEARPPRPARKTKTTAPEAGPATEGGGGTPGREPAGPGSPSAPESKAEAAGLASGAVEAQRDPLRLNLPMPLPRSRGAGGDAPPEPEPKGEPSTDAEPPAPPPTPPPSPARRGSSLFDGWFGSQAA